MAVLSRALFFLLALGAALTLPLPAHAQNGAPMMLHENKIKAGLLYNFLKYTQWPDSATLHEKQHMQVCLLGGDAFEGDLAPLDGRTAQHYTVRIAELDGTAGLGECSLVYINRSREEDLAEILGALQGKPVLTMSDIPNFTRRGGMVAFATHSDGRIHLRVSQAAVA